MNINDIECFYILCPVNEKNNLFCEIYNLGKGRSFDDCMYFSLKNYKFKIFVTREDLTYLFIKIPGIKLTDGDWYKNL